MNEVLDWCEKELTTSTRTSDFQSYIPTRNGNFKRSFLKDKEILIATSMRTEHFQFPDRNSI